MPVAAQARSSALGTAAGVGAVLLWALLALFTTGAKGIPPFQLLTLGFAIVFVLGTGFSLLRGRLRRADFRQPAAVWALGVGGLFDYHFFYFVALGNAPPADASLIAYLWPLLIVLFSGLLPGERLRWFQLAGALAGFAGAGLLVARAGLTLDAAYLPGYAAALACALIWSSYSVANRRFGAVPTDLVGPYCGGVAVLGGLCHLVFEDWSAPDAVGWLAVLGLGLGPVGAAFFLWDYGTKRGRIQLLGVFSYLAPLLSTILLVACGQAAASWRLGLACLLIVVGAALASADALVPLLARRRLGRAVP